MLSRAGIFRVAEGVAVDMSNRVFQLPSFNGTFSFSGSILQKELSFSLLYSYWDYDIMDQSTPFDVVLVFV